MDLCMHADAETSHYLLAAQCLSRCQLPFNGTLKASEYAHKCESTNEMWDGINIAWDLPIASPNCNLSLEDIHKAKAMVK